MTNLTDRMRTCAAYFAAYKDETLVINPQPFVQAVNDAMNLLIEAADALDKPQPLGEPMVIIKPVPPLGREPLPQEGGLHPNTFVDPGPPAETPTRMHRSCPKCGSRAAKTVHVASKTLKCPACDYEWAFVLGAKWV